MNANYKTWVPRISTNVLLALTAALAGCTQDNPRAPAEAAGASVPAEPLVIAPSPDETKVPLPQQKFEINAGDSKTVYVPEFNNDQLISIEEHRTSSRGQAQARYEFQGARLLRYSGAAFETEDQLELEFNLQGAVVSATLSTQPASQQEITRARERAQLLRSHALAQQATRTHSFSSH